MRIILGIIAFTITFGLSTGLVGILFGFPQAEAKPFSYKKKYTTAYKYKIKKLLRKDVRNGDLRNIKVNRLYAKEGSYSSLYYKDEYRKVINDYYIKSSSMNDSFLPEDFKYAWREHMNAWKKQAEYLNSLQDESYEDGIESNVRRYSDNTNEINRTWFQVLRIAKRYGVKIPRNYYQ